VRERDAGACSVDGSEKGLFPGAIWQSAKIAKGHCGGPNEGEEQSHHLSENQVLGFDPTQLNAKCIFVWGLKGDDLAFSSPKPSSGGGTWNLQLWEEVGVAALDYRFSNAVVVGPAHGEIRIRP
jgi:hypothetical protein